MCLYFFLLNLLFKGAGPNFQTRMTTTLEVDPSVMENPTKTNQLHFLPCQLTEDVPNLPADSRFTSFTVDQGVTGQLSNQLRGRPLDGAVTSLPDGYTGLVLEGRQGLLANQDKTLRLAHQRSLLRGHKCQFF